MFQEWLVLWTPSCWKTDLLATDPRSHCTFKASWLAEILKWDPGRMVREMFNVTFSIHFPYISRACQAKSRVMFWKVIKLKGKLSLLMIEHLDVCDGWYPNNANLPHLTIFNSSIYHQKGELPWISHHFPWEFPWILQPWIGWSLADAQAPAFCALFLRKPRRRWGGFTGYQVTKYLHYV